MRSALVILASACVLAACNPAAPGGGAFPSLSGASYRAEANIAGPDGVTMPVVMIRDGAKMRMEFVTPQGPMVMITNPDTGEDYVITGGTAMRLSRENVPVTDPAAEWQGEMAANATRTGDCSVAGERGVEWTRTAEGEGDTNKACVTNDGIILRALEGERTVWETTSVQRGAQDASLFALPPGTQVMDLGAMMNQIGAAANGGGGAQLCNALRESGAPAETLSQAGC